MGRGFVRFLNGLVSLAVGLSLLIAGAYAGYCLWDNHQIYAAAENVQDDMIRLKPKTGDTAEEQGPSFAELLRVNQDVKAWLTLDHTQIDYPVLQGEDNFAYINTDVYGNSRWRAASLSTPAATRLLPTRIPCFTAIIWKTAGCSAIWIFIRSWTFSGNTTREP